MEPLSSIIKIISENIPTNWYSPYKTSYDYTSIGTGFFINMDGWFLTCAHVVDEAVKIWIQIPSEGKKKFSVELVAICYDKDIALLKATDYKNTTYCTFGESDKIKKGDSVIAMGYPLGQDKLKYSNGIISGRQDRFFQTTAPINKGNSGGPLLNSKNEVIGINTSKISSAVAENISYAIPIYDYINIQKEMTEIYYNKSAEKNKIIYEPRLLWEINNADASLLQYYNCPKTDGLGCFVKKVYDASPLCKIGMNDQDILYSFNNIPVDNYGECRVTWSEEKVNLQDLMSRHKISDKINIMYFSSKTKKVNTGDVKFKNEPVFAIRKLYPPFDNIEYEIFGGMVVMNLCLNHLENTEDINIKRQNREILKSFFHTRNKFKPVLIITNILQGSNLSSMDTFDVGEIIVSVDDNLVQTLEDFRNFILNRPNKMYVKIRTFSNTTVVFDLPKLLTEDLELSSQHKYKQTKLCVELLNQSLSEINQTKLIKQI